MAGAEARGAVRGDRPGRKVYPTVVPHHPRGQKEYLTMRPKELRVREPGRGITPRQESRRLLLVLTGVRRMGSLTLSPSAVEKKRTLSS